MQLASRALVALAALAALAAGRLLAPPAGAGAVAKPHVAAGAVVAAVAGVGAVANQASQVVSEAEAASAKAAQIEAKVGTEVKAAKAREEQMMAGIAQTMANADAVHVVGLKAMEKMKEDAKVALAPLPVDAKQAAAGRSLLKMVGKNGQGVKVEEDEEGTEMTAEKLLEAVAASTKDAKMRQLFETTKDSIKAMRTKQWKNEINASAAEMEKDVAREAKKALPAELKNMTKWSKGKKGAEEAAKPAAANAPKTAATGAAKLGAITPKPEAASAPKKAATSPSKKADKKKVASFYQAVAKPVPIVSGVSFEQGLAYAKKENLVDNTEFLLGLLVVHQTKQDLSAKQQLDATKKLKDAGQKAVARVFLQVARAIPLMKFME